MCRVLLPLLMCKNLLPSTNNCSEWERAAGISPGMCCDSRITTIFSPWVRIFLLGFFSWHRRPPQSSCGLPQCFLTNYLWIPIHNAFWGDREMDALVLQTDDIHQESPRVGGWSDGRANPEPRRWKNPDAWILIWLMLGITADYDIPCITSSEVLSNMQ